MGTGKTEQWRKKKNENGADSKAEEGEEAEERELLGRVKNEGRRRVRTTRKTEERRKKKRSENWEE